MAAHCENATRCTVAQEQGSPVTDYKIITWCRHNQAAHVALSTHDPQQGATGAYVGEGADCAHGSLAACIKLCWHLPAGMPMPAILHVVPESQPSQPLHDVPSY